MCLKNLIGKFNLLKFKSSKNQNTKITGNGNIILNNSTLNINQEKAITILNSDGTSQTLHFKNVTVKKHEEIYEGEVLGCWLSFDNKTETVKISRGDTAQAFCEKIASGEITKIERINPYKRGEISFLQR